jgi:hypothetical protein
MATLRLWCEEDAEEKKDEEEDEEKENGRKSRCGCPWVVES